MRLLASFQSNQGQAWLRPFRSFQMPYYGFTFQWFYTKRPGVEPQPPGPAYLDLMINSKV